MSGHALGQRGTVWHRHNRVLTAQTGVLRKRPKALGAWNLNAAPEGVPSLELFGCFSCVIGSLGNTGAPHYS